MSWFLLQAICGYRDLSSLTKLINKFNVTKYRFQLNANFIATVYELPKFDECQEAFLVA